MNLFDDASTILSLVAVIISIVTFGVSVIHNKKKDTLDAFNVLQNEALDKLYYYSRTKIEDISKTPGTPEYKELTLYMTRIEHFCVGINKKIYDLNTVKCMAGEYLCPLYEKMLPLIEKKRKVPGAENVYADFEKAVCELKKK